MSLAAIERSKDGKVGTLWLNRPQVGNAFDMPMLRDHRDTAAVESLASAVLAKGPVDIVIHCAGGNRPEPFISSVRSEWDDLIAVNLRSVIQLNHALLSGMLERGWAASSASLPTPAA